MIINQLTVLTDNKANLLADIIAQLSKQEIDIRAHCLVDNGDGNCKLRIIVSNETKAVTILQDHQLAVVANEVVAVEVEDKPGGLTRILSILKGEKLRIAYSYVAVSNKPGTALMVFKFSDNSHAAQLLEKIELQTSKR